MVMILALDLSENDVLRGTSIREASKRHLVDRTYLTRRINGIPTKEEVDEKKQVLSRHQETHLANWAIAQGRLGYAPPMIRFRFYAQHIPETQWRVDGANTANINLFFDRFDTPEVQHIPLRHTYNADEFGLMEELEIMEWSLGNHIGKFVLVKDHQKRTWTSILECKRQDLKKRRRVIPDPNKDFVELHEVQTEKARLAAEGGGESDIHSDLEGSTLSDSGSEKSSEAEDCIELQNDEYHRALSEFTHFRMRTGGPEDLYLELFVNAQGKKVWMDGAVASTNGDFEWEGVLQWTGDILRVGTEVPSVVED
ncbi:hypothetical protein FPOA_12482 [Fusarium poae]|uniref:HTH psq-type domain-containing protein n=1 Tax=Fusarium poae TaxID=36050 RepID=A0A1B8A932_FUSPO|nr:hypothetical protein FPOA_12482 [Fusarium poae]